MSTSDVVQIMVRKEEDVEDCMGIVKHVKKYEWPVTVLLELKKAYPRVSSNRPVLRILLERCGLNGKRKKV